MNLAQPSLDELVRTIAGLPPAVQRKLADSVEPVSQAKRWTPSPGPQTEAYYSEADVLLYGGEPGGGKGLSLDTPIPTPNGFTTMGELRIGDEVFDRYGARCRVTFKSPVHNRPCFKLTFSDGEALVADDEHLWVTRTRRERLRAWRDAKGLPREEVRSTLELAQTVTVRERLNHSVDLAGPIDTPHSDLLVDPYVLGLWLGDGHTESGAISGIDEAVFTAVANAGYVLTQRADPVSRGVLGLQKPLRMLGVLNNKHIPAAYLRASKDQRLALLQGLMDTDGHCDTRGQCEIQLTRKALIDGVHELLVSLGIKVQLREGLAKLYGRVVSKKWRLKFLTELPAFRLPRKLLRQKRAGFRGTHCVRYLTGVESVPSVPTQCIQVDSESRTYLAGTGMVPTHNTQLLLGLAFNEHRESMIFRRKYTDLDRIIRDALDIHGSRAGFNGSAPPKLRLDDERIISFRAAQNVGDEQSTMGDGRDFLGIDEATHFAKTQIQFLMGWVRTKHPGQRTRTVLATNPPLAAEGLWVVEMFAPWLDPQFPNPAKPGELRWVVSDEDGNDRWVADKNPVEIGGRLVYPKSRTYIPASVGDNPYYVASGYQRELDAMPEPFRSILMGGFRTSFRDAPNQVIPTAWVQAAQSRWKPEPPEGVPCCAMGVDMSGGGDDPMVIAPRWDGWYDNLISIPGKDIPQDKAGAWCAGQVLTHRCDKALVVVDLGGGYGGSMYERLKENDIEVVGFRGAEGTTRRSKEGKHRFPNKRSAAHWLFREALDPGQPGGSPIALPPSPRLLADLTAPTFEPGSNGIKVESKIDVCARLGRSTDEGDAVIMAWFEGPKETTAALEWIDQRITRRGQRPQVIGSRSPSLSARRYTTHG